jgi:elongation factor G
MLCGTAFKNKGVQRMLDAVIDFLPSPVDIPPVTGEKAKTTSPTTRALPTDEKFSALAFKLMTDKYVGQLTFIRVYSGVSEVGGHHLQPDQGQAASASVVWCRCTPTIVKNSKEVRRRRHRCLRSASRT